MPAGSTGPGFFTAEPILAAGRCPGMGRLPIGVEECRNRLLAAMMVGNFQRTVLGAVGLNLFVVLFHRVFWRPLYARAERKFRIS